MRPDPTVRVRGGPALGLDDHVVAIVSEFAADQESTPETPGSSAR